MKSAGDDLAKVASARQRVRMLRAGEEFLARSLAEVGKTDASTEHARKAVGLCVLLEELTELYDWLAEHQDTEAMPNAA